MRILIFVFTIFFFTNCFSQTIWDLYEEKDRFHCDTCLSEESRIIQSYEVLKENINNKYAQHNILSHYSRENRFDQSQAFIDSLITQENLEPESYVNLAFTLINYKPSSNHNKNELYLNLLHKSLSFSETKGLASFLLSQYYYLDFIIPIQKDSPTLITFVNVDDSSSNSWETDMNKMTAESLGITLDSLLKLNKTLEYKTVNEHAVDSAMKYLNILSQTEHEYKNLALIPLNQLKTYKGNKVEYQLDYTLVGENYFPEWYFGYLPLNWRMDSTINLFEEMFEHSYYSVSNFSNDLKKFDEPILYKNTSELTYRIYFDPSFHNPIIIRFYKQDSKYFLVWKVIEGKGGYETNGILKNGEESITKKYFNQLATQLDSAELSLEDTYHYITLTDGAKTLIERSEGEKYKAYNARLISENIKRVMREIAKKHFPEIELGDY